MAWDGLADWQFFAVSVALLFAPLSVVLAVVVVLTAAWFWLLSV